MFVVRRLFFALFAWSVAFACHSETMRFRGAMLPLLPTEKDIADLAAAGANLGRYQMHSSDYEWPRHPPQTDAEHIAWFDKWLEARLKNLETNVLRWARRYGMRLCVDLHKAPGGNDKDRNNDVRMYHNRVLAERYVEAWRQIAERLKGNEDVIYGYDLLNEPVQAYPPEAGCDWRTLQQRAAEAVRAVDAKTALIFAAPDWDQPRAYAEMKPFAFSNAIYQVHCYKPEKYTHQGTPGYEPNWCGYPCAATNDRPALNREFLRRTLQPVLDFQRRTGARIYVGEFSAIAWAKGSSAYIGDLISLFEEYGWDWSYHAWREWPGWNVEMEPEAIMKMSPAMRQTERAKVLFDGFKGIVTR